MNYCSYDLIVVPKNFRLRRATFSPHGVVIIRIIASKVVFIPPSISKSGGGRGGINTWISPDTGTRNATGSHREQLPGALRGSHAGLMIPY